jgi:hypothetical protein
MILHMTLRNLLTSVSLDNQISLASFGRLSHLHVELLISARAIRSTHDYVDPSYDHVVMANYFFLPEIDPTRSA